MRSYQRAAKGASCAAAPFTPPPASVHLLVGGAFIVGVASTLLRPNYRGRKLQLSHCGLYVLQDFVAKTVATPPSASAAMPSAPFTLSCTLPASLRLQWCVSNVGVAGGAIAASACSTGVRSQRQR